MTSSSESCGPVRSTGRHSAALRRAVLLTAFGVVAGCASGGGTSSAPDEAQVVSADVRIEFEGPAECIDRTYPDYRLTVDAEEDRATLDLDRDGVVDVHRDGAEVFLRASTVPDLDTDQPWVRMSAGAVPAQLMVSRPAVFAFPLLGAEVEDPFAVVADIAANDASSPADVSPGMPGSGTVRWSSAPDGTITSATFTYPVTHRVGAVQSQHLRRVAEDRTRIEAPPRSFVDLDDLPAAQVAAGALSLAEACHPSDRAIPRERRCVMSALESVTVEEWMTPGGEVESALLGCNQDARGL